METSLPVEICPEAESDTALRVGCGLHDCHVCNSHAGQITTQCRTKILDVTADNNCYSLKEEQQ